MKTRHILAIALVAWCLPWRAFAETTIKATVDKTSITTDDAITYTLTVSCGEKIIPNPTLPSFEHFSVLAQVQSSNFSFGKDGIASSVSYTFSLAPLDAGTFTIQAAQIKVKGQVYKSNVLTIEVKPGTHPPEKAVPSQSPPLAPEEEQMTL